jgi:hypothetical protein
MLWTRLTDDELRKIYAPKSQDVAATNPETQKQNPMKIDVFRELGSVRLGAVIDHCCGAESSRLSDFLSAYASFLTPFSQNNG